MMYKVKGKIAFIGEKKVLENNALVVDYIVNHTSENGYVTPYSFNIYKKEEYADIVENFIAYNKVGDEVEVEFTIRGKEYNGRVYNSLSHWRCDKCSDNKEEVIDQDGSGLPF